MITFDELTSLYTSTFTGMSNASNFEKNVVHTDWTNLPTLARWLHGSNQTFLKEFNLVCDNYSAQEMPKAQSKTIAIWRDTLRQASENFRVFALQRFPNSLYLQRALS